MGLATALSQVPEARPNMPCRIFRLREQLDGDDLAAFNTALEAVYSQPRAARMGRQHGATATWLARVLTENGFEITDGIIQRHVRGECSCGSL
jgi:hypothetical protein